MFVREHPTSVCEWCGEPLWYGVKEEAACWKVYYICESKRGCGREWTVGTVPLSAVTHRDEVYERAESLAPS